MKLPGKMLRKTDRQMQLQVANSRFFHILGRCALYIALISAGFVFLYPLLVMLSSSFKDLYDLSNSMVNWIPTKLSFVNYSRAFTVLGGSKVVIQTIGIMLIVAVGQTLSSAVIAYGFAKYNFWGKKLFFALMIATFILPQQVTFLPKYVMFHSYNMQGTIWPILLPSLTGQGLKNALFILIYYQFFRMSPKSLDEAAAIDGAGRFRIFAWINMRIATPATVVVFIFSFVWNWNETNVTDSYFGNKLTTLPLALEKFRTTYAQMFPASNNPTLDLSEGITMAGTLLSIIPLIILYVIVERKLIESIDKSGITGE